MTEKNFTAHQRNKRAGSIKFPRKIFNQDNVAPRKWRAVVSFECTVKAITLTPWTVGITGKNFTAHQRNREQARKLWISNPAYKEGEYSHNSAVNPSHLHQPSQRKPQASVGSRHAGAHSIAGQAGRHTARRSGGRIPRTMPPLRHEPQHRTQRGRQHNPRRPEIRQRHVQRHSGLLWKRILDRKGA